MVLDFFYVLFLMLTWAAIFSCSPEDAQRWALAQEVPGSRWRRLLETGKSTRVFSGGAGLSMIVTISALGMFFALFMLPQVGSSEAASLQLVLCALGVATSWTLLHTSYGLYYVHLYYQDKRAPGGLYFPGEEAPGPLDFAYFAFTLGTAFAVSDVQVSSRRIRRVVLSHSVLAFFYNTAILALAVNLILSAV